jgi:hypothetical protein
VTNYTQFFADHRETRWKNKLEGREATVLENNFIDLRQEALKGGAVIDSNAVIQSNASFQHLALSFSCASSSVEIHGTGAFWLSKLFLARLGQTSSLFVSAKI